MGHSVPSTVVSAWPTTTITTTTATLSASAPTSLPATTPSGSLSTSNTLSTSKPQTHRPPYKARAICCPHQHWSHHQYILTVPQMRTGMVLNKRKGRGLLKPYKYRTGRLQKRRIGERQKEEPFHMHLTCWVISQIYPIPTLQPQPQREKKAPRKAKGLSNRQVSSLPYIYAKPKRGHPNACLRERKETENKKTKHVKIEKILQQGNQHPHSLCCQLQRQLLPPQLVPW